MRLRSICLDGQLTKVPPGPAAAVLFPAIAASPRADETAKLLMPWHDRPVKAAVTLGWLFATSVSFSLPVSALELH